jgi:hypothetical protein
MFKKISHIEGLKDEAEILFSTSFNYFFPEAARSRLCLLPVTEITLSGLRKLGDLMADSGAPPPGDAETAYDSNTPAIFTYFGQFIDHDLTARTDRDSTLTALGRGEPIIPLDPDEVIATLRNGRRPQFDLDSVFGDGPGLADSSVAATTQSQILYNANLTLNVFDDESGRIDLPRKEVTDLAGKVSHTAVIADMRNDENINISQLHTAFLKFYNAVYSNQSGSNKEKYIRARQLVRWAYQYVVINDYLMTVCDQAVVRDTLANGPRFIGATAGKGDAFMPLEFSTAAFRFGHSMIRPFYRLNAISGNVTITDLLGPNGNPNNFDTDGQLKARRVIDWQNFAGPGSTVQKARKIDTRIARGLFNLPLGARSADPVLKHLARSNLLRGYNLSVPTGQAVCDAFGIIPMTPKEIRQDQGNEIAALMEDTYLDNRTPLWFYILREAAYQQNGERLGELGSRLVCETMIGLMKQDPNSYLNNMHDPAVKVNGIDVNSGYGGTIKQLTNILEFAGVAAF